MLLLLYLWHIRMAIYTVWAVDSGLVYFILHCNTHAHVKCKDEGFALWGALTYLQMCAHRHINEPDSFRKETQLFQRKEGLDDSLTSTRLGYKRIPPLSCIKEPPMIFTRTEQWYHYVASCSRESVSVHSLVPVSSYTVDSRSRNKEHCDGHTDWICRITLVGSKGGLNNSSGL